MERSGEEQTGREEDKKGSAKDNRTEKERIETPIVCINIEFIRKNVLDVCVFFCFFSVCVGVSFISNCFSLFETTLFRQAPHSMCELF